jgi:hypothetical protein
MAILLFSKQRKMKTKLNFIEKHSYLIVVGILFIFLLFGCSARNTNKSDIKIDSTATTKIDVALKEIETIKETTKIDSLSESKKQTIVNVFTDELELEPIDAKEISTFTDENGKTKTFKNVRIKTNKRKDKSIIEESERVRKIEQKDVEIATLKDSVSSLNNEIAVNKEIIKKLTEKPQFNWSTFVLSFWWLWIIILIALYLAYRYYKGYLKFPLL